MHIILVTGGTDGMGRAAALRLASPETLLLVIGRDKARGNAVQEALKERGATAYFLRADLSTRTGMREAVSAVRERVGHLDWLVHSAGGVFTSRRTLTEDGLELAFAIMTLARFVLTNELMPLMEAVEDPRVLAIGGGGSLRRALDLEDLQGEKSHSFFGSIGRQSIANDVLTAALIAKYPRVRVYNYGPGLVRTKLPMPNLAARLFLQSVGRLFSRSPDSAAKDVVALLKGEYPSGFYGPKLKRNDPRVLRRMPGLEEKLRAYLAERAG